LGVAAAINSQGLTRKATMAVRQAEKTLQGQIAEIIERREDGRVSARFDNGRLSFGREAGSFERVAGLGAKGKWVSG
jgi:hypothetical protein